MTEALNPQPLNDLCLEVSHSGAEDEPLACAWQHGHEGDHSWASLQGSIYGNGDFVVATILSELVSTTDGDLQVYTKAYDNDRELPDLLTLYGILKMSEGACERMALDGERDGEEGEDEDDDTR